MEGRDSITDLHRKVGEGIWTLRKGGGSQETGLRSWNGGKSRRGEKTPVAYDRKRGALRWLDLQFAFETGAGTPQLSGREEERRGTENLFLIK